jgi:hypothetical protein
VFGTVPLGIKGWAAPILLGAIVFFVVEGEKYLMRRWDALRLRHSHAAWKPEIS